MTEARDCRKHGIMRINAYLAQTDISCPYCRIEELKLQQHENQQKWQKHDKAMQLRIKELESEVERLRETISEFLDAISGVPMRAIDCNQEEVYRLQRKLEKAAGEK